MNFCNVGHPMCGTLQWQIENISFSFPFLDHSSMTPVFHSPVCSVVLTKSVAESRLCPCLLRGGRELSLLPKQERVIRGHQIYRMSSGDRKADTKGVADCAKRSLTIKMAWEYRYLFPKLTHWPTPRPLTSTGMESALEMTVCIVT